MSESTAAVSFGARLLFAGLWTLVDREGRWLWKPKMARAQIFPHDNPDHIDITAWVEELVEQDMARFYEVDGRNYLWLPTFTTHQRPHPREPASVLPAWPAGHDPAWLPWKKTASHVFPASIPSSPVGREGKGREQEGKGTGTAVAAPAPTPSEADVSLIRSPKDYHRASERCAYVGARLEVPNGLHADLMRETGTDAHTRLLAWYATLDEEIEHTGEAIAPDVFKWLRGRWKAWIGATRVDVATRARRATLLAIGAEVMAKHGQR
jgi:hypothetical protein